MIKSVCLKNSLKNYLPIYRQFVVHQSLNSQTVINEKHQTVRTISSKKNVPQQTVRTFSSEKIISHSDIWTEIYRLPMIRWAAAFNRLKNYQLVLTAVGIPTSFALESSSFLTENGAFIFTWIGLTGVVTLTVTSLVLRNLIGFMYINESTDKIKIGYVDFWGHRKNVELKINSILPYYETSQSKFKLFQNVQTNDENSIKLKLMPKFSQISNNEVYSLIFGD